MVKKSGTSKRKRFKTRTFITRKFSVGSILSYDKCFAQEKRLFVGGRGRFFLKGSFFEEVMEQGRGVVVE